MQNISLQQYVSCSSNPNQLVVGVNCKSWELNPSSTSKGCDQYCTLKKKKTNFRECYICKERTALTESVISPQEKIYANPAEELKDKLPQHNFFTKEKMDKYRMHKNTDPSFVDKAKTYTRAELSQMFTGKVTEEVFEKRKALCMECPRRSNPHPGQESIGWCKSCGCSAKNPRAALSNKLWMPSLVCPLNKFGKEVGSGFKAQDAVDSVKGALDSVVSLFKKEDENEKTDNQENNQQKEKA